jgi:hypothetical protein
MTKRTGYADLPLHRGKAPRWLFTLMRQLAREIAVIIVEQFSADELLRRLADPVWLQAFGCTLGFDWHSSGLTTTTLGALKDGLKGTEQDLGIFVAGGKGNTARKTPQEITTFCDKYALSADDFIYASKLTAKVDNNAVQDGYQLYHHVFVFSKSGNWTVIQQGMHATNNYARRYHWLAEKVENFVNEPHTGIVCDQQNTTLNMVAQESAAAREAAVTLAHESPDKLITELKQAKKLLLPRHHAVLTAEINPDRIYKSLTKSHEANPQNFTELLATPGVGPKAIRALALLSDLIFKAKPSYQDPAKYSFAHGGKDGHPYPVDKTTYQTSILALHDAVTKSKIGHYHKMRALARLKQFLL